MRVAIKFGYVKLGKSNHINMKHNSVVVIPIKLACPFPFYTLLLKKKSFGFQLHLPLVESLPPGPL